MKKLWLVLIVLCFMVTKPSFQAHALTFNHLPTKQTSKQWSVEVGKAELDKTSVRPKKGVYELYSFKVKNIEKNVDSVTVQAFRDEPNSKTKFALFEENKQSVMIEKKGRILFLLVFLCRSRYLN